jgi:hypothetical protein
VSVAEHIPAEQALFLTALAEDDPEKRAALSHAAQCEACARLLRESTSMLRMLDEQAAPALEPIDARLEARVRAAVLAPPTAAGLAAQPPAAAHARWEHFAWLVMGLLSGWLIWHDGKPNRPLEAMVGLHCLRYELFCAFGALGIGVVATRLSGARALGPLRSSVLAMGGALVGQLLLRTRCEAPDAALHLLAFHGLGVLLATALGGLAGRLLTRPA